MRSAWTWCSRIVERTLSIGLGIKRSSKLQIGLPQLLAFPPPFEGLEAVPLRPLVPAEIFGRDHSLSLPCLEGLVFRWEAWIEFPPGNHDRKAVVRVALRGGGLPAFLSGDLRRHGCGPRGRLPDAGTS